MRERSDKGQFIKQLPRYCSVEGCSGKHSAKGFCSKHLMRIYRNGTLISKDDITKRFHESYTPVPECGCWLWEKSCNHRGYGQITKNSKTYSAHRLSWELHKGPIPEGMCVLHKCDVPECVNPDHLFLGTQKDNIHDAIRKGRVKHVNGKFAQMEEA